MKKRFKVVQDARGRWGIHNTTDPWQEGAFASWGKGYPEHSEIVHWAIALNEGTAHVRDFHWIWYHPKWHSK